MEQNYIGRDWLDQDGEEQKQSDQVDTTEQITQIDMNTLAALNVVQIEDTDQDGQEMGGFKFTKKKGNYYECRMCKLFSINQNDVKQCINPECESNIVKPRVPGKMTTDSVIRVGNLMSKQQKKNGKNQKKVRGKEFEKGKIPDFDKVSFTNLHHLIFQAQEDHQFLFIADLTGKAATACEYSTYQYFAFHGEHKKFSIAKKQTLEDSIECLRRYYVNTMQNGYPLIIDMDTLIPPLKSKYDTTATPLKDLLFNPKNFWMPQKDYKKILRDDEDKDKNGNKGLYCLNDKFSVVILCDASDIDHDDEILQMLMDELDNIDDFQKVYLTD